MNIDTINKVRQTVANNSFATKGPMKYVPVSDEYIRRMTELGEKYRNVRWLPLDIPKIEFDNLDEFKDLWDKEAIDVVRIKPCVAEPWSKEEHPLGKHSSWNTVQFRGLTLYQHPLVNISDQPFAAKLYQGDNPQLKRIVEQVMDLFPIHTMMSLFIWQSTMSISPHQDQGTFWKCPTDFRVMLHDENTEPTLYTADIEHGDVHYVDLPPDTNSFCWSNGSQIHGSDYNGKKKFLLCMSGIQHSKKSDELFERSINKYRDQLNYKL